MVFDPKREEVVFLTKDFNITNPRTAYKMIVRQFDDKDNLIGEVIVKLNKR